MKPHAPGPADLLKAVLLSEGSECPVFIAHGSPWFDTQYSKLVGDDLFEDVSPEFLINDNIITACHAARRARFEFGETPRPGLFERMIA